MACHQVFQSHARSLRIKKRGDQVNEDIPLSRDQSTETSHSTTLPEVDVSTTFVRKRLVGLLAQFIYCDRTSVDWAGAKL
jgi:hypothetical protein